MELALAESSIFIPPVILAVLVFVYRNSILPFASNPFGTAATFMSKELILRRSQFVAVITNTIKFLVQFKDTVLHFFLDAIELFRITILNFTQPIFDKVPEYMDAFTDSMKSLAKTPVAGFKIVQTAFHSVQVRIEQFAVSAYNTTKAGVFKASEFLYPTPKTSWEKTEMAAGLAFTILVLLVAWWYLQYNRIAAKTPIEEPPVQQAVAPKKAVHRRRKVN